MGGGRNPASSRRLSSLLEKFRHQQYRDSYVASHTRGVLAQQMRNFRGDLSQAEYAEKIEKQKTVIGRLENPGYTGWSLRTMLEIARKEDVAVIVRFVDFPTFLKYSGDLSDAALHPASYDEVALDDIVERTEADAYSEALMGLFFERRESLPFGAIEALERPSSSANANKAERSNRPDVLSLDKAVDWQDQQVITINQWSHSSLLTAK